MRRWSLPLLFVAACAGGERRAARLDADRTYAEAERAFSQRDDASAEKRFTEIAERTRGSSVRALALYRLGELRERASDLDGAVARYRQVIGVGFDERGALAAYRIALITLEDRGQVEAGQAALRALPDDYPDSGGADKAIRYLAAHLPQTPDADPARAVALVAWLRGVIERHPHRQVADHAMWWRAYAQLFRLGDIAGARASLRELVERWPDSSLIDDVLWYLGAIYHRQGEPAAAAACYRSLQDIVHTQRSTLGSFRSRRLDDSARYVALLRYHAMRDFDGAEAAWRRLLAQFASSVMRDDAWWGIAMCRYERDDRVGAETALRALIDERPDSRFAERARRLLDGDRDPSLRQRPDPAAVPNPLLAPRTHGDF